MVSSRHGRRQGPAQDWELETQESRGLKEQSTESQGPGLALQKEASGGQTEDSS